jgi:hypothetical protein
MARAFWIIAAGLFLVVLGPFVDYVLVHHLAYRPVQVWGVPALSAIGLVILAYGLVKVGATLIAAWRAP